MLAPNPAYAEPAWPIIARRTARRPGYALHFYGRVRGPSPAMRRALAAFEDHARRWVAARRDTLFETGSDAQPCRDGRLDLQIESTPRRIGASL